MIFDPRRGAPLCEGGGHACCGCGQVPSYWQSQILCSLDPSLKRKKIIFKMSTIQSCIYVDVDSKGIRIKLHKLVQGGINYCITFGGYCIE